MLKKQGFAVVTPFSEYVKVREQFEKEHPSAVIIEEIKTLTMGIQKVPDPLLIGRSKDQQILMIAWGVVFEEEEKEKENFKSISIIRPNH